MPELIRWIEVDSSGSMKPDESPMAITLRFHAFFRRPVTNRRKFGSAPGLPARFFTRISCASSSDMYSLQ